MSVDLESLVDDSHYDVVIIGAGMVGASVAIGLADMGLNILLVDSFDFSTRNGDYAPSYDERSTALSSGTKDIFRQLGLWDVIAKNICHISGIHVSEQKRFGGLRMSAEEQGQEALGYVVRNNWLGSCLIDRIGEQNITFCTPAKVSEIQSCQSHKLITLSSDTSSDKQVRAELVIICDGANSDTAKLLGIGSSTECYKQHALVANITTELPNEGMAFERFTPNGPLALLPLSSHECSLVWTHESQKIDYYMEADEAVFCRELEQVFGERLGKIEKCGQRNSYPLKITLSDEQCRSGILLLGNAAHSIHPVAGQGFNLAIRGVASFLEMVKELLKISEDSPSYARLANLSRLCESRESDLSKTVLMSDQLVKVFVHPSPFIALFRDLGLIALDNQSSLKSAFANRAMGLSEKKARFG